MSQSNVIAGTLFLAFFFYITAKGELPTYLGFFGIGRNTAGAGTASANGGLGSNPISDIVGGANAAGAALNTFVTNNNAFTGSSVDATAAFGGYGGN